MPKYYCDYCDIYLSHDSPKLRREHCEGRNHLANVRHYYGTWMQEQVEQKIDQTRVQFNARRMAAAPYFIPPPPSRFINLNIPPPPIIARPTDVVQLPNAAPSWPYYPQ